MTNIVILLYNRVTNQYTTKTYETDSASVDDLGILHIGPREDELAWFNKDAWVAADRVVIEPEEPELQYDDEE